MAEKKKQEVIQESEEIKNEETPKNVEEKVSPEEARRAYLNEKVPFKAYKDKKIADDIFVCVNGKTFLIQRGVQVNIPRYVYLALEASERQKGVVVDMATEQAKNYDAKRARLS